MGGAAHSKWVMVVLLRRAWLRAVTSSVVRPNGKALEEGQEEKMRGVRVCEWEKKQRRRCRKRSKERARTA